MFIARMPSSATPRSTSTGASRSAGATGRGLGLSVGGNMASDHAWIWNEPTRRVALWIGLFPLQPDRPGLFALDDFPGRRAPERFAAVVGGLGVNGPGVNMEAVAEAERFARLHRMGGA